MALMGQQPPAARTSPGPPSAYASLVSTGKYERAVMDPASVSLLSRGLKPHVTAGLARPLSN
jgi:hypothetical protein